MTQITCWLESFLKLPNQTLPWLLSPPWDVSEHILIMCKVTALSQHHGSMCYTMNTNTNAPSPNADAWMLPSTEYENSPPWRNFQKVESACLSFPFLWGLPHPALSRVFWLKEDGPNVTQEPFHWESVPYWGHGGLCSSSGSSTWTFCRSWPVQLWSPTTVWSRFEKQIYKMWHAFRGGREHS